MSGRRTVRRASSGHRIGEYHHNATYSDEDVQLAIDLHDAGLGYGTIAKKLSDDGNYVDRMTVRDWVKGRRRS